MLLGSGSYGSVYLGNIDGKEVAIKKVFASQTTELETFKQEVLIHHKSKHDSVVELIGIKA